MKTWHLLWFLMLGLLAIALFFLSTVKASAAPAPTTWTENWTNATQWRNVDTPCFAVEPGKLHGVCQSAAFQSLKRWAPNQNISVSWTMSGKPAAGSSTNEYFVGMTLWQREDSPKLSNYQEIALVRHVPPFTANDHTRSGILSSPQSGAWNVGAYALWDPIAPGPMYSFKLDWLKSQNRSNIYWYQAPAGQTMKWFNGNPFVNTTPVLPVYIRLLVVCVGEGQGDNGCKADGVFGPITVTGVQI